MIANHWLSACFTMADIDELIDTHGNLLVAGGD